MKSVAVMALVIIAALGSGEKTKAPSSSPQDVFNAMQRGFEADKARGIHARFQFDLSGPEGGLWWIEVNDATCKMGRGRIDAPGVTLVASDRDWVALSNGTLQGWWAYLTGRLKIRGDQKLARKLGDIFQ